MKRVHLIAFPFVLAAVVGTQAMVDRRPEKKTMVEANPFHKLPPAQYAAEYVAANLLGGLRAVAIDYLWIQFTKAEREQRWVEVNAILEMIVHLQPNFAEVWNHLTWARAYNIAAQMDKEEDRQAWIKSGLDAAEKGAQRNPGLEKLWFQKGYIIYHRIPQDAGLVEWYRREYGRDSWQDAAEYLERAMLIAQSKGRNNTVPPCDGLIQESYNRLAFVRMRRGDFDGAVDALRKGHETYHRLVISRDVAVTGLNRANQQLYLDLIPIFELERELTKLKGAELRKARHELRRKYVWIEVTYAGCLGAQQRILELQADLMEAAFDVVRAGKPSDGARQLENTAWQECADIITALAGRGRPAPLWIAMCDFYRSVANAMNLESKESPANCAAFYEEHIDSFRFILPPDHPLMELLRRRAGELRGP